MFGATAAGEWVVGMLNASVAASLDVRYAVSGFYWLVKDGVNVAGASIFLRVAFCFLLSAFP